MLKCTVWLVLATCTRLHSGPPNPSSRTNGTLYPLENKLFIPLYPSHHHPTSCFYESGNFRYFLCVESCICPSMAYSLSIMSWRLTPFLRLANNPLYPYTTLSLFIPPFRLFPPCVAIQEQGWNKRTLECKHLKILIAVLLDKDAQCDRWVRQ